MKAKHLFISTLCCFLFSLPSTASDWVDIGSNKDFTLYVDKQSITGDTNSKSFWAQRVLNKEERNSVSGKYYIKIREYWEIDCNKNIIKLHEFNYYSIEGVAIYTFSSSPRPTSRIVTDSMGEAVEKYVCSFK